MVLTTWWVAAVAPALDAPVVVWGLTWSSPPECIRPAELAERIERSRSDRTLFGAHSAMRLEGRIAREGSGWNARLTLVDQRGTVLGNRQIQSPGPDCRDIDERLVLIASVLINTLVNPVVTAPPLDPPTPPHPALLTVLGENHFSGDEVIGLAGFYRRLGRPDLVDELHSRQVKRILGFSLGGVGLGAGGLLAGAYALGVGCVRRAGTGLVPGECLERSAALLVTSVVLLAAGAVSLLIAANIDATPTTLTQDAELAKVANERRGEALRPVRSTETP